MACTKTTLQRLAGVPPDGTILALNGTMVATRDEVSALLNETMPGEPLSLTVESEGVVQTYHLILSEWPADYQQQYGPAVIGLHGGRVL